MLMQRDFSGLAIFMLLMLLSGAAFAAGAGTVTHLSGTLAVQRADGTARILSQKSEVRPGDVLTTQRDSYAQINFTDGSSMTMRPNTQLKIEAYHFVQDRPQEDRSFLRLIKGGLRTVTGLVGKRGDQDAYKIGTNSATIGIRGSSGDTLDCTLGCEGVTNTSDKLARGVYHATYTGAYVMQNGAGSQLIREGQFGYVRDPNSQPVLLPGDPGMALAQLPFTLGVGGGGGGGGASQECVVR
ncbi:MAG: FecR domain-containing protein [Betaproteobacteria bacterium]|nr:FecR domain-containing protein [Betaproteobacteria bacterium]